MFSSGGRQVGRSPRHPNPTNPHNNKPSNSIAHRHFSTTKKTSGPIEAVTEETSSFFFSSENWSDISLLLLRAATAISVVHIIDEYVLEIKPCEGLSMHPTIFPMNEIVLMERVTPRLFGMDGGSNGEERARSARLRQKRRRMDWLNKKQEDRIERTQTGAFVTRKELEKRIEEYEKLDLWQPETTGTTSWDNLLERLGSGVCVGDVVILENVGKEGTICKRVIGLPGDVIVKGGQKRVIVVPDGHVWVEGDNSPFSRDSRDYGAVPAALVLGKVLLRIWPLRGNAFIERGERPIPEEGENFTGSTVLPAGYQGESVLGDRRKARV